MTTDVREQAAKADVPDLKCWVVECFNMSAKVYASCRGRARYIAAIEIHDAGWATVSESLTKMTCHRHPEFDVDAISCGKEAVR
jgi:hypothetical protein